MSIESIPTLHPDPEFGMVLMTVKKEDTVPQQQRLTRAKQGFLYDAELFGDSDKELFREDIEKIHAQTERTLEWLSRQELPRAEFIRRSGEALDSFNEFCRESKSKWIENRLGFHKTTEKLSMIDKMIANINASSPPALPQERVLEKLKENPFYLINRENKAQSMAIAQLGAVATDLVVEGAKAVCKMTPATETACRATLEFGKMAISKAGDVGKATLDLVGLKEPMKRVVTIVREKDNESLKRHLERTYDIPPEVTQNYVENIHKTEGLLSALPIVNVAVKAVSNVNLTAKTTAALGKKIPLENSKPRDFILSQDAVTITAPHSNYFKERIITQRTKMVPEDIGIPSVEFYKNRKPFQATGYNLEGWITLKKNEILKIRIENIAVPEGRLSNWLTVMEHFKEIARVNQAKTLQFELQIVNEKLLEVMIRRYGAPSNELKSRFNQLVEYQIFKIRA